jgi:hypothetical protein
MTYLLEFFHEHALAIDFAMFVLIWLVQLIVYPVFHQVETNRFVDWHRGYCNKIGLFVLPLAFAQLIEAASSCFFVGSRLDWVKLVGVLTAWLVTLLVSAPCHRRLSGAGKDSVVIQRLLFTNWIRTFLWSGVFAVSVLQY